ncbi:MAG: GTP 3',8-cyclase MoaA [Lachnospiraceae bacterium]|nr:GTP 3',8-cyclase MoaA [Lachnospiraceae bacterium]
MRDSYGREIDYMRISVTDRCNLRCRYCMPDGVEWIPMEEILTFEEIARLCRVAVKLGITKYKITGGEPLVRRGCPALVRMIREIPGVEQVTMTSNGILLERYLGELLGAGLTDINVSLDTTDRGKYQEITGFDELPRVLRSIRVASEAGLRIKINAVLQTGLNEDAWDGLLSFAREGLADVRFIELMPIGRGADGHMVSNERLFHKIEEHYGPLTADGVSHGNGPAVYYRIADWPRSVGFISAIHGKFCGQCNRLRLGSTGRLKPCLCYEDSLDVRGALRDGSDAEVCEILKKAILGKPRMHCFENTGAVTERQEMAKIGG